MQINPFLFGLILVISEVVGASAASTNLDLAAQAKDEGKYKEAQEFLEQAASNPALSPVEKSIALNNLGYVEIRLEKFDEAIEHLTAAIQSAQLSEPNLSVAYINRAIARMRIAEDAKARDVPGVTEYLNTLMKDSLNAAIEDLNTATSLNSASVKAHETLAKVLELQGKEAEAKATSETAEQLKNEESKALFSMTEESLYLSKPGLLLGNKLEWLFGAFIVLIYSYRRFNTPKAFTASTTMLKFHFAGVSYYISCLLLFFFIASLLAQSPNLLSALGVQPAAIPADLETLSGPLITALLLTALLPHAPILSRIDESLLAFFRRIGQIPVAAAILSSQLRRTGIRIPERSYRRGYTDPIDVKDQILRFAERKLVPISKGDLEFENRDSVGFRLATTIWLLDEITSWEGNPAYRSISDLFSEEVRQIHEKFEKFVSIAIRYFELNKEVKSGENGTELTRALSEVRDRCDEVYDDLFRDICDLIARAVLRRELSSTDRKYKLDQLGFCMPGPTLSFDNFIGIGLITFVILFTTMSLIGAALQEEIVSKSLLIATMVTIIYVVAIACAILPKTNWAFANIKRRGHRPWAAYLVSALMAVVIGIAVSIIFKAIQYQNFYLAVYQLKYSYPWFYLTFTLTLVIAYLADSHSVTPQARPSWLSLARRLGKLSKGAPQGDRRRAAASLFRSAGLVAAYLGGDRAHYRTKVPAWISVTEAAAAAGLMAVTTLFALRALVKLRTGLDQALLSDLALGSVPSYEAIIANALIGFFIALLVPHWHRRSLENASLTSSDHHIRRSDLRRSRQVFRNLDLFCDFETEAVEYLWRSSTLHNYPSGTPIIQYGTPSQNIHILLSGMARAERRRDQGQHIHIATFHDGDTFGESSMFNGTDVQADVTALKNCEVARFSKEAMKSVFENYPSSIGAIVQQLVERNLRKNILEAENGKESQDDLRDRYHDQIMDVFQLSQGVLDLNGGGPIARPMDGESVRQPRLIAVSDG